MKKDKHLDMLANLAISIYSPEELAVGFVHYQTLRAFSPRMFAELSKRNLTDENFEDMVTEVFLSWEDSE
jgi:nitric oxide synthase oxygenase domain/subunit